MKKFIGSIIFLLFACNLLVANMGSPYMPGTMGASPFTSKYVNITNESLLIVLNKNASGAQVTVEYHINSEKDGMQIPMLFYAFNYSNGFKIWMDGNELKLKDLPSEYNKTRGIFLSDFDYFYKNDTSVATEIDLEKELNTGFYVSLADLKYFETNISKGEHIIKVEYKVEAWTDRSDWINQYTIKYALSPAKYWKSFGNLKLTIDATAVGKPVSTNLGNPSSGTTDSVALWNFDKLPVDIVEINYKPHVSAVAKAFINIGPGGLSLIFTVLIIAMHVFYTVKYRKNNLQKRFSGVMISGSFIIPALAIIFFIFSFPLIDSIIGDPASQRHGYYFLIIIFYPVFVPVYLLIMWLVDRFYKRYLIKMQS